MQFVCFPESKGWQVTGAVAMFLLDLRVDPETCSTYITATRTHHHVPLTTLHLCPIACPDCLVYEMTAPLPLPSYSGFVLEILKRVCSIEIRGCCASDGRVRFLRLSQQLLTHPQTIEV